MGLSYGGRRRRGGVGTEKSKYSFFLIFADLLFARAFFFFFSPKGCRMPSHCMQCCDLVRFPIGRLLRVGVQVPFRWPCRPLRPCHPLTFSLPSATRHVCEWFYFIFFPTKGCHMPSHCMQCWDLVRFPIGCLLKCHFEGFLAP
jgi:hypothetical protein